MRKVNNWMGLEDRSEGDKRREEERNKVKRSFVELLEFIEVLWLYFFFFS